MSGSVRLQPGSSFRVRLPGTNDHKRVVQKISEMEPCASYIWSLLGHGHRIRLWHWVGPEVIGYIGAGCGVGFSVGITLAGVGVGLPANRLLKVPFSALMATRGGAVDFARSSGLLGSNGVNDGINVTGVQRWVSTFNYEQSVDKRVHFSGVNRLLSSQAKLVLDYFDGLKSRVNHPH